jgi:hypothetical protein
VAEFAFPVLGIGGESAIIGGCCSLGVFYRVDGRLRRLLRRRVGGKTPARRRRYRDHSKYFSGGRMCGKLAAE